MLQIQKHHTSFVTIVTYGHVSKLLIWVRGHIVPFVVSKRIAVLETPVTAFLLLFLSHVYCRDLRLKSHVATGMATMMIQIHQANASHPELPIGVLQANLELPQ